MFSHLATFAEAFAKWFARQTAERVYASSVFRTATARRRSRVPGPPGRAGAKLARMAAEQRIGLGHPR